MIKPCHLEQPTWLLTPVKSNEISATTIYYLGSINVNEKSGYTTLRPSFYLDSSVYVIDGNGSISDPYIIGM